MKTSVVRLPALGLLMWSLVGCSTAPCTGNPNTDSISCVQSGINSGAYQRRVDDKQAEAQQKQREVEAARAENDRLQSQIADARAQEQSLRARIAAQRTELDRLSGQISQLAAEGQLSPGEASMRRAQLDYIRQRQTALQQSGSNARELQQKAATLQGEIDALNAALARAKS